MPAAALPRRGDHGGSPGPPSPAPLHAQRQSDVLIQASTLP